MLGKRQIHRAEFAAKESARRECFQLFLFADTFQALADIDEGRHDGIRRTKHCATSMRQDADTPRFAAERIRYASDTDDANAECCQGRAARRNESASRDPSRLRFLLSLRRFSGHQRRYRSPETCSPFRGPETRLDTVCIVSDQTCRGPPFRHPSTAKYRRRRSPRGERPRRQHTTRAVRSCSSSPSKRQLVVSGIRVAESSFSLYHKELGHHHDRPQHILDRRALR